MGKSMFKQGYSAVREEKQRQDEAREKAGKNLYRFFLANDGDEAEVRFLTEEPVTFNEHNVRTTRNGKDAFESVVCCQEGCSLCATGDRPTFKGAFLIWDMRPYEVTDKDGKKQTKSGQLRLYVQGARVLSQLDRISSKYGLTNRTVTIIRLGKGTNTSYTIEKGDEDGKLSKAEIENMLPEKLRPMYNGTMESLYDIVKECLSNSMADVEDDDDDEELSNRRNLVGVSDDDDEAPLNAGKKSLPFKKKGSIKGRQPIENSVKALFRKSSSSK